MNFRKQLLAEGIKETIIETTERKTVEEIEAANRFAQESPPPAPESVLEDGYVQ